MRKTVYIVLTFLLFSCDTENGSDCLKVPGAIVSKTISLEAFSKLTIYEGITLEIRQGTENNLSISYGKNLIADISTTINQDRLEIRNNTRCNLIRNYEPAKLILTATNLQEIRNASQFAIFSTEVIRFNTLTLISENFFEDVVNVGDFELQIENESLSIISNNVSNFTIAGTTDVLDINFAAGQGKFNGNNLVARQVQLFHRGINEIQVWPVEKISGEIRGAGNVLSFNRPGIIEVEEFYTGKLIFTD